MKKNNGTIAGFRGDYRFLSNFERCDLLYKGIIYKSSESAFQAQKTDNEKLKYIFSKLDARESKVLGREIKLIDDWDMKRIDIMYDVLYEKFSIPKFKSKLLSTGNAKLIESNHWGDDFWGVYKGQGENHLGNILMEIREDIRENTKA